LAPADDLTEPRARVAVGVPLYGDGWHLEEAIESLLGQRFEAIAFVMADDGLTDDAYANLLRLVVGDPRVTVHRNERRLGLLENWRHVFELARLEYPEAEFYAWGSDHDVWHPAWASHLVAALDAKPDAVIAFPRNWDIDEEGDIIRMPWSFQAVQDGADARVRATSLGMSAGNMVYGLYTAWGRSSTPASIAACSCPTGSSCSSSPPAAVSSRCLRSSGTVAV
jgi:glycosyltransferase involved in cell wall biosynthesis